MVSTDAATGVLLSSSTNSFDGVIAGVKIDAKATSPNPVTITISRDQDAIEGGINDFIDAFNDLVGRIDTPTDYNPDTQKKGTLLGDSTALQIRQSYPVQRGLRARPRVCAGQYQYPHRSASRSRRAGSSSWTPPRCGMDARPHDPQAVADLFAAKVAGRRQPPGTSPA